MPLPRQPGCANCCAGAQRPKSKHRQAASKYGDATNFRNLNILPTYPLAPYTAKNLLRCRHLRGVLLVFVLLLQLQTEVWLVLGSDYLEGDLRSRIILLEEGIDGFQKKALPARCHLAQLRLRPHLAVEVEVLPVQRIVAVRYHLRTGHDVEQVLYGDVGLLQIEASIHCRTDGAGLFLVRFLWIALRAFAHHVDLALDLIAGELRSANGEASVMQLHLLRHRHLAWRNMQIRLH